MLRHFLSVAIALSILPAFGEISSEAWSSVVRIRVSGTLKVANAKGTIDHDEWGTGFMVSPDGLILSVGHNFPDKDIFDEDGFQIEGYLPEKFGDELRAVDPPFNLKVIYAKQYPYDVALLKTLDEGTLKPFLRLCDGYDKKSKPKPEFEIQGYQGGDRPLTSSYGRVANGAGPTSNLIIDAAINKGNSGGPLFNELGMVFGIAIGEREIDGERMKSSTLAVPMARAIEILGENAISLLGVSYDPDCNKLLNPEFRTVLKNPVEVQTHTFASAGGILGSLPMAIQIRMMHARVRPPEGYRVVSVEGVTFDYAGITGTAFINNDGGSVDVMPSGFSESIDRDVTASVPVILEKVTPNKQAPSIQLRIFPYSKTLDKHGIHVTSTNFHDTIKAPDGFVFQSVVKIDYQSLNNSPSNGASASVNSDGTALDINYSLQSGPFYDQWRGWIDAYIIAKIAPKNIDR